MTADTIPTELWTKILSFLRDPRDFIRIRRTSSRFHTMVNRAYFQRIRKLQLVSHADRSNRIGMFIIESDFTVGGLFVGKTSPASLHCRETRTSSAEALKAFQLFWTYSTNLTECIFEGFTLEEGPIFYKGPPREPTAFLQTLVEVYSICAENPRRIKHLRCIPNVHMPRQWGGNLLLHRRDFEYYRPLHRLTLLWTTSLERVEIHINLTYLKEWVRVMKTTTVTDYTLHFPLIDEPAYSDLHPLFYTAPYNHILIALKELFHQPDREVKRVVIHIRCNKYRTYFSYSEYNTLDQLLVHMTPVEEFTFELPHHVNKRWITSPGMSMVEFVTPMTPFRMRLRILNLGPQLAFTNINLTYRMYRTLFPNLEILTGIPVSYDTLKTFWDILETETDCTGFESLNFTIKCQPVIQSSEKFWGGGLKAKYKRAEDQTRLINHTCNGLFQYSRVPEAQIEKIMDAILKTQRESDKLPFTHSVIEIACKFRGLRTGHKVFVIIPIIRRESP